MCQDSKNLLSLKLQAVDILEELDDSLAFGERYASVIDNFLKERVGNLSGSNTTSVLALGSYGRKELAPFSDIDITVVLENAKLKDRLVRDIFYPLWDQQVKIDYSIRTKKETLALAKKDLRVLMGLLDARVAAGSEDFGLDVIQGVTKLFKDKLRSLFPPFVEVLSKRYITYGELGFLKEPNIKEAKGGIRDIAIIERLISLFREINPIIDMAELLQDKKFLMRLRIALHRRYLSAREVILLQDREDLAKMFSFEDSSQLMREICKVGRRCSFLLDDVLLDIKKHFLSKKSKPRRFSGEFSQYGYLNKYGEIERKQESTETNLEEIFAICLISAKLKAPIEKETLFSFKKLTNVTLPIGEKAQEFFFGLLQESEEIVKILESLDFIGVLTKIFPVWASVSLLPQTNFVHRYSVDRHLFETVKYAQAYVGSLRKPYLLLLACLLHDIGKASEIDHSVAGVEIASQFLKAFSIEDSDKEKILYLIRNHLLLIETATRRDLEDISTILTLADQVPTLEDLDLLYFLTRADARATSEKAFSDWREKLLDDLYFKMKAYLLGELPSNLGQLDERIFKELLNSDKPSIKIALPDIYFYVYDKPGILAAIAGVLSLRGVDIISLRTYLVAPNEVVDCIKIKPNDALILTDAELRSDLIRALEDPGFLKEKVDAHIDSFQRKAKNKASFEPEIRLNTDLSDTAAAIEVKALDSPALLYLVAQGIFEAGLDIKSALIDTLADEAIDVFYVRDANQGKPEFKKLEETAKIILDKLKWLKPKLVK